MNAPGYRPKIANLCVEYVRSRRGGMTKVGCGLDFATDRSFDEHRVGTHEYTFVEGLKMDPPVEDGRRCLDLDEMKKAGWDQDKWGRWRAPGHPGNETTEGPSIGEVEL